MKRRRKINRSLFIFSNETKTNCLCLFALLLNEIKAQAQILSLRSMIDFHICRNKREQLLVFFFLIMWAEYHENDQRFNFNMATGVSIWIRLHKPNSKSQINFSLWFVFASLCSYIEFNQHMWKQLVTKKIFIKFQNFPRMISISGLLSCHTHKRSIDAIKLNFPCLHIRLRDLKCT